MRVRDGFCALALILSGCAHSGAPAHWLPHASAAAIETHGGWVVVHLKDRSEHAGELLAVDADSVFVLEGDRFLALASVDLSRAVVTGYDAQAGKLGGWTAMGAISTFSHGYGLVVSLPTWVILGGTMTALQSHAGRVDIATWETARAYARFPQGLPAGLDRATLRQKPVTRP